MNFLPCLLFLAGISGVAIAQTEAPRCGPTPHDVVMTQLSCAADSETCAAWREFRSTRPYPYQTIYVANKPESNQFTVIISEIPPVGTHDQLVGLVAATLGIKEFDIHRLRYQEGPDGWLEDMAVTIHVTSSNLTVVPGAQGDAVKLPTELLRRLKFLSAALFGTPSVFYVDTPDAKQSAVAKLPNLQVNATEIMELALTKGATWKELTGNSNVKFTFRQIAASKTPAAVIDEANGVVMLHIPTNTPVAKMRGEFRKFAVSSDYLVGAVRPKNGGLLLLARSRVATLRELPPLRYETLESLAASLGKPLGQSYERQRVFAGKIASGNYEGWDWAPIYLSPQLQDTEFGTLLNIADQQLKSWSECGHIDYATFQYPFPSGFPFNDEPASAWIQKETLSPSLIFNWNTQAFSTATDTPAGRIITTAGTSALPVSYIVPPNPMLNIAKLLGLDAELDIDAPLKASARGSEYFSQLGDPILARVVQNVFLYQVLSETRPFRPNKASPPVDRHELASKALLEKTTAWVNTLPLSDTGNEGESLRNMMSKAGITRTSLSGFIANPEHQDQLLTQAQQAINLKIAAIHTIEERATLLEKEHDRIAPLYKEAFLAECRKVGGNLTYKGSQVDSCHFKSRFSSSHPNIPYEKQVKEIQDQLSSLQKDHYTLVDDINRQGKDLKQKLEQSHLADKIVQQLKEQSAHNADLNDVLTAVLRVTSTSTSSGAIRTPSIVLSRNSISDTSVGGHNIDSLPWLVQPRAAKGGSVLSRTTGDRPTLHVSKDDTGDSARIARGFVLKADVQAREASNLPKSLELPEPVEGSFLAKLESIGKLTEPSHEIMAKAKNCQCDIYVEQSDNGIANMVSLKPPPSARSILGDPALIEALADVTPGSKVVFSGFKAHRATALGENAFRKMKKNEPSGISEFIEHAKRLFDEASESVVNTVMAWRSSRGNLVQVIGEESLVTQEVMKAAHPWPIAEIKPVDISTAVNSHGNFPLVEIFFPKDKSSVGKISVYVHYNGSGITSQKSVLRSTSQVKAKLDAKTSLEAGVAKVLDQIYTDSKNIRAVEFHLQREGEKTVLRFVPNSQLAQLSTDNTVTTR